MTTYEIQSEHNGNWEVIPEGEFTTLNDAEVAVQELEKLGDVWKGLRIVRRVNGRTDYVYPV